MGKDPKLHRNSWHSWRIPGGFLEELTLVQKILRNPKFLEELTPVQKLLRPTITQEFLGVLEESWRN